MGIENQIKDWVVFETATMETQGLTKREQKKCLKTALTRINQIAMETFNGL